MRAYSRMTTAGSCEATMKRSIATAVCSAGAAGGAELNTAPGTGAAAGVNTASAPVKSKAPYG